MPRWREGERNNQRTVEDKGRRNPTLRGPIIPPPKVRTEKEEGEEVGGEAEHEVEEGERHLLFNRTTEIKVVQATTLSLTYTWILKL